MIGVYYSEYKSKFNSNYQPAYQTYGYHQILRVGSPDYNKINAEVTKSYTIRQSFL